MARITYVSARIVQAGMGGFLNPPGHPEHTSSVETDLRRHRENRGGMSLSAAATCDYIDPAVRAEAKRKLAEWSANPPSLESPEMQAWVLQILGYFRSCYRNPDAPAGQEWHASHLVIDSKRAPMEHASDHAGVNLIRQYYPGFEPTAAQFANAQWGAPKAGK